jgi:AcrR family transcriptional regulator
MARIVKQPEERRNEIIHMARECFVSKGYDKTSVNDIIQRLNVAKGTFYHYFKSKDEIANAVIQQEIDASIPYLTEIAEGDGIPAHDKFMGVVRFISTAANVHYKDGLMIYLHHENNVSLHLKMKIQIIRSYAPIVSIIIKQGVKEEVYHTHYPEQVAEFLLIGLHFMLDPSFFTSSREQFQSKINSLEEIYQKMLGAKDGQFSKVKQYLSPLYYA